MTKDQQAALEQVARELREKLMRNMEGRRGFQRDNIDDETKAEWDAEWDALIMPVLAAQRAAGLEEVLKEDEVWSFMRRVLSQGGDIQLDYQAGKYKGYEEYSARLDAAARERADQFIKEAQEQRP